MADSIMPLNVEAQSSYILPVLSPGYTYYTDIGGPNGTGCKVEAGTVVTSTTLFYIHNKLNDFRLLQIII